MDNAGWILLAVIAAVIVAVIVWTVVQKQRRQRLQTRFGPEYDHTVKKYGSVSRAESELAERQQRVERFEIKPLRAGEAERFAAAWRRTQARFVDAPREAIIQADRLVREVMEVRGYPVGDFEQRVADISVDHAGMVHHYRAAHKIAVANVDGAVDTEDLRQAMVHYRALFEDLLEVRDEAPRRKEA